MNIDSQKFRQPNLDSVSWNKSLRFRLLIIVALVSLFWGITVTVSMFYTYQSRIEVEYKRNAIDISKTIAAVLDGETIDRYLDTLVKDEEYERIRELLKTRQRETGVMFIYVSRFVEDGEVFIFDTDDDPEGQMDLGEFELWSESDYDMRLLPVLLRGGTVEPYVYKTHWGRLLTAHEPIYRSDGSVAGYLNVDISLERLIQERNTVFTRLGLIVLLILAVSMTMNIFAIRRFVINPVRALIDGISGYRPGLASQDTLIRSKQRLRLRNGDEFEVLDRAIYDMESRIDGMFVELRKAEERTKLMLDTSPLCCQLWDRNLKTIDCNEAAVRLYGFKNKQEYVDRFISDCSPEYQPDGQSSGEKAAMLVKKAFDEGRCVFDWMHKIPGGALMPAEITLVRVSHGDDYIVAGYTRDLRNIVDMENKIIELASEADKIYYDPLTGIYNRRYFDEELDRLMKIFSRSSATFSLMMIDIDFFKNYNDTYGHSEGDNCLKIIANTLAKSVTRAGDFVARYGGEEFAAVLPNTDGSGACRVAERMHANIIRNGKIPHESSTVAKFVTVSIGVATGNVSYGQGSEVFIRTADEMLYKSKQEGRNRYSFKFIH